jgi:hypothetical protein
MRRPKGKTLAKMELHNTGRTGGNTNSSSVKHVRRTTKKQKHCSQVAYAEQRNFPEPDTISNP